MRVLVSSVDPTRAMHPKNRMLTLRLLWLNEGVSGTWTCPRASAGTSPDLASFPSLAPIPTATIGGLRARGTNRSTTSTRTTSQ